ncbi:DUF397 domain-containing protein [Actinocorallia libanotica]|uniref:DUF397 domain-containing protein n=1 Tax=Actinocorallia libanotica TaxID=46162 RepID=A0ABN1RSY1_9ACTN
MNFLRVWWRKSSYSTEQGNCLEVSVWRKTSSSTQQGSCVEVAPTRSVVLARDSKNPDGHVLGFGPSEWRAFVSSVKAGRHDLY